MPAQVGAAAVHLFGFKPAALLGRSLCAFVDALEPHQASLTELVSAMLVKASEKPGLSWRVGVHPPWEPGCSGLSPTQVRRRRRCHGCLP